MNTLAKLQHKHLTMCRSTQSSSLPFLCTFVAAPPLILSLPLFEQREEIGEKSSSLHLTTTKASTGLFFSAPLLSISAGERGKEEEGGASNFFHRLQGRGGEGGRSEEGLAWKQDTRQRREKTALVLVTAAASFLFPLLRTVCRPSERQLSQVNPGSLTYVGVRAGAAERRRNRSLHPLPCMQHRYGVLHTREEG